ncbi:MAG: TPM domain-containing protein [Paracoccus sp. (in: a-proteobacteria)]|nr:TPM domain-containing protein [Paracoccus sp. (in: a-proteobacteria)]
MAMMLRIALLLLMLACPAAAQTETPAAAPPVSQAQAQPGASLPDYQQKTVNDFANLLSPEDAGIIDQALAALDRDNGIEGTVVTLADAADHGGSAGLERFATQLFNHWGVGDRSRNDGFMILILRDDRAARIELGAGYPASYHRIASQIMDREMLPEFRAGDYSAGLRKGTLAVIERIALPHASGAEPPAERPRRNRDLLAALFFGLFALLAAFPIGIFALIRWQNNRCGQCRNRELIDISEPIRDPTRNGGWDISRMSVKRLCQKCGWTQQLTQALNYTDHFDEDGRFLRRTRHYSSSSGLGSSSGGSSSRFGGGSSSGGGASGRW